MQFSNTHRFFPQQNIKGDNRSSYYCIFDQINAALMSIRDKICKLLCSGWLLIGLDKIAHHQIFSPFIYSIFVLWA